MLADEIEWPNANEIEHINRLIVAVDGEPFLVLSRSALESATNRPLNYYLYEGERDIIALAVRLIEGIGQNHPFQQGNKRTAFIAALDFIERNGGVIGAVDDDELGKIIEAVIIRECEPALLIAALREHVNL